MLRLLTCLIFALLSACTGTPTDKTPAGVVRLFIERMDVEHASSAQMKEAYVLLDPESRRELDRRAVEAAALSGRAFRGWDMMPPGRFHLRFAPRTFHAREEGGLVVVEVRGDSPSESADVEVVREKGAYRIKLGLAPAAK